MLRHWLQKTIQTFNGALQINLKRFPITLFFILSLTCYLCYLVAADQPENKKLYWILGYYLSVGTLLSLSLHLWCEEIKSLIKKSIIQTGAHALLIADAFYLYSYSYEKSFTEIGIAHGAGLLAIGLSIFFLSFLKEKNDIPSWNFAVSSITSCITANLIGCVMSCGISLLVLSLHKLFNIDIDTRYYLYIVIICNVCLPLLLFLGLLPSRQEKHNTFPLLHSFLNNVIHYLFLPLTGGYLIVLYIYALRILASWELPIGWVSWLVIALMTGCIAIEFGLYPTRMAHGKRMDELIARWLPAFVLPLLCLMTIGIIRRFNDYGVTINRLYLITLNVWCYFVCITLILIKAKRINWIPVSFSIIFLLTSILPVNYSSITQKTIQNEINKEIQNTQQKKLPFSHEEYTQWLKNFSSAKAQSINEKIILDNLSSVPYGRQFLSKKEVPGIIATAKDYIGVPYVFGGDTPAGFDCSGYLEYVFAKHGIRIPRTADEQYKLGKLVEPDDLEAGDLVFFTTYEPGASHCGIYLGNGNFIHASTSRGIRVDNLDNTYWASRYYGGKHIVK